MSFPDQRSGELLLVAHRIVNLGIAGRPRRDRKVAIDAVTDWASRQGAGVYQLPLPHHLPVGGGAGSESGAAQGSDAARGPGSGSIDGSGAGPGGSAAAAEARAFDAQRLEFVFGQLDVYRAGGYSVLAAVAIAEDLEDPREVEWWRLFAEVAQTHGWEQLRVLTVGLDADEFSADPEAGAGEGAA